jgi:hypothetical protein
MRTAQDSFKLAKNNSMLASCLSACLENGEGRPPIKESDFFYCFDLVSHAEHELQMSQT